MMKNIFALLVQFVQGGKQLEKESEQEQVSTNVAEKIARVRERVGEFLNVPEGLELSDFHAPRANVEMGKSEKLILTAKDVAVCFAQMLHAPEIPETEVSLVYLKRKFKENSYFVNLDYCWVYKEYYISLKDCCEYGFFDARMYEQQADKTLCTSLVIKPEYYLDLVIDKGKIKPRCIRYFLWHEKYYENSEVKTFAEDTTVEEALKSCEYVKKFA